MKSGKFGFIGKAALMVTALLGGLWTSPANAQDKAPGVQPAYTPSTDKLLYSFSPRPSDYRPQSGLTVDAAGHIYGTDVFGGSRGSGAAFELSLQPGGIWTETVLHDFHSNSTDGRLPSSGLVLDPAGNLYGVTAYGGTGCPGMGCGTVYELLPQSGGGWTEKILHDFSSNGVDGTKPVGNLVLDAAGNLYGVTSSGGSTNGYGIVFALSPQSNGPWLESVLYSFTGALDAANPNGSLIRDSAGNLYGTTLNDVDSLGSVFELSQRQGGLWTENVLYSFQDNGQDGHGFPAGLALDSAGNIYGTTLYGGTGCLGPACGTVFELSPQQRGKWTEKILYSFQNYPVGDGAYPLAGVTMDAAGILYGTTSTGGINGCGAKLSGCGIVFKLSPQTGGSWTETILHTFRIRLTDGQEPEAGLIFDTNGNLLGTTVLGGATRGNGFVGGGTVFEITP